MNGFSSIKYFCPFGGKNQESSLPLEAPLERKGEQINALSMEAVCVQDHGQRHRRATLGETVFAPHGRN